jgi:hypothetical protein
VTWLLRERLLGWRQEIEGGERFAAAPVLVYPIKARSMLLLLEPALVLASTLAALGGVEYLMAHNLFGSRGGCDKRNALSWLHN